jgi:methionine-rich copper-binding protein CopC
VIHSTKGAALATAAALAMAVALPAALPLFGARPAAAHAIVLESEPPADAVLARPPGRVVLRFNSKIEKRLSRVTLTAGRGSPVPIAVADPGASGEDREPDRLVVPLRSLPPGGYTVRYKVLSADGHITEGALRFTVSGSQ